MPRIKFSYSPLTAGEHTVGLCGDFTDWKIISLPDVGGNYQIQLYVNPGKHRYKLVVDGKWMPDPSNPSKEADPFGGENSILIISANVSKLTWNELTNPAFKLPIPSVNEISDSSGFADQKYPLLSMNRMTEDRFEWRFKWFKSLAETIIIHYRGTALPLYKMGSDDVFDLYHNEAKIEDSVLSVYVEIRFRNKTLFYDKDGLSLNPKTIHQIHFLPQRESIFEVPEWVREGIIYQIFPDRFYQNNKSNNPDFSEWYYSDCKTPPPSGEYLPPQTEYFHLINDWKDISGLVQSPYLPKGKPDWWSFYGGDIAGITDKLDYLVDLGISIVYLNPLWQAKSNHKYDAADYMKIDPHFGTEQELDDLVHKAHSLGIRIILDVAFNHTGETFWAFRGCIEKGPFSDYWSWYDWHKYPLPNPLPPDFDPKEYYQCWWGVKDMPDLNYDLSRLHPDENYVRDIAHAVVNKPLVDYVLKTAEYWLVDRDLDGFRLDVPDEVPFWFWELFRKHVKKIKPDAWLVGEIWHNAEDWVNSLYFDSVMNYAYFKSPLLEYLFSGEGKLPEFQNKIEEGLSKYPIQALSAMMNLMGSHDTWRIFEIAKANTHMLKLAILFQMCFVGTPHIYYGDEIGMRGKKDPDNRRPFDWDWQNREEAVSLRQTYKDLISIRKANSVLVSGEFSFIKDNISLCHFHRYDPTSDIHIVLNPGKSKQLFVLPDNARILYATQAYNEIQIPARCGIIYQA